MGNVVPMADPAAEYRLLKDDLDAAVSRVLASGRYILGPQGESLERELATYTGATYAVGVNSGTDALHLALVAAGVGRGDEVIVPGFTFFATAEAVSLAGATPIFADIDPATFNLDLESTRDRITPRTRAVIAVHLFGQCAGMDEFAALCDRRGVVLIEDCAQALGADYAGRRAGSWGALAALSFYPTKTLAAAGDGGMVLCRDRHHDAALRMLRHHGSGTPGEHACVGFNSRLDELQAAVLRVKLEHLERFIEARRANARRYRERLGEANVVLPHEHDRGRHVFQQYTIRTQRREALQRALERAGIASSTFYLRPVYRQPAYVAASGDLHLPGCEVSAATALSLPVHPFVDEPTLARICDVVRSNA